MLESLMTYLKVKEQLVDDVNMKDLYTTESQQKKLVTTIAKIRQTEPVFLILNSDIHNKTKDILAHIDKGEQNKSLAKSLQKQIQQISEMDRRSKRPRDYYYQFVTVTRNMFTSELDEYQQIEHVKRDYKNMVELIFSGISKPVCDMSLLSTINFTYCNFKEVYKSYPELMNSCIDSIEKGLQQETDKQFVKSAKRTLKKMQQSVKTMQKQKEKLHN